VNSVSARFGGDSIRREFKNGHLPLTLALRLQGKFKTAFPGGKPKAADDAASKDKKSDADNDSAGVLKESAKETSILLVGDTDLLYDRFCIQKINFLGMQAHQPINDNLTLVANAVEQSSGNVALAGIRTRGKTDRPFGVVLDLQRKAQERYMAEEQRLQKDLADAQQRLSELQRGKNDKERFILSPQQKEEIIAFRKQVADTKEQLRQVRKKLREDIESLGMKVKLINILLIPVLVALFGIGFYFYRSRRSRS
jgi:ABC-type uncharacterized transport system involved in gliding motility auxiliary subunit